MDLAVTLIKSVMRAFYTTRDILVIDALILHETLRDDDLAYLMSINTKDLHKICGKLREDRFLTVHTRPEKRPDNPRPSNRTYYYINYRQTIDAIKWRVYTIDKEVQGTTVQTSEMKEYFCSFCKAEWTTMEVLDNNSAAGFLCHRCGHVLTFEADRNAGGHEQSTRLNDQFKFITEQLRQIDQVHIPECDFERALAKQRPVERDATHQRVATIAMDDGAHRPMDVKGLSNLGPQSIAVNISTAEGATDAEKEAERARKERIAKQNALPSWMSASTVSGESFGGNSLAVPTLDRKKDNPKDASQSKGPEVSDSSKIDDIFEKLKAEQLAAAATGGDESGSEEDEDEFEDIPVSTPIIKKELSDGSDWPQAKRVKIEPGIKDEPMKDAGEPSDEDDDEELEFEDI
ncbi:unnamed protein product [Clonostachys chloroleuca]|uniref:HTH TFE/IIEalpha-type domain-containing protein n=1 Tax=Clonostachys chloroleuca TaxID=1926264 RepID=A0AA35LXG6_9HYPO|nr:unnamed protein product [Clonostachys chloroleuca]